MYLLAKSEYINESKICKLLYRSEVSLLMQAIYDIFLPHSLIMLGVKKELLSMNIRLESPDCHTPRYL